MSLNRGFASALVLVATATSALGADLSVLRLTNQPVDDPWAETATDVLSSRGVIVDTEALRSASPGVGARFMVPLGNGLELTAVVREHEIESETRFTAWGQLDDDPFSTFLLVGNGSALVGSFRSFEHGVHELRLSQSGGQVLRHKLAQESVCGVGSAAAAVTASSAQGAQGASSPPPAAQAVTSADTGEWVDILIAYTTAAKAVVEANGWPTYQDHAALAVFDMNIRLNNSEFNEDLPRIRRRYEFVLVGEHPGPNTQEALAHLANADDGIWDEVHPARSFHGADLVHVIVKDTTSANLLGMAYRPSSHAGLTKALSYGISRWDTATTGTFAHELGHNFGCHHHPDDKACATCPAASTDPVIQPWAFGHRFSGSADIRTTMAYQTTGYDAVPYFSQPDASQPGLPALGIEGQRDNALVIHETSFHLAQYEASVTFVKAFGNNTAETGTYELPYKDLQDGVLASVPGHPIKLLSDSDFTGTISEPVVLSTADFPWTIGEQ